MAKPRPIMEEGYRKAEVDGDYVFVKARNQWDMSLFDLKQARRLHAWLGRAIAWMEEKDNG